MPKHMLRRKQNVDFAWMPIPHVVYEFHCDHCGYKVFVDKAWLWKTVHKVWPPYYIPPCTRKEASD